MQHKKQKTGPERSDAHCKYHCHDGVKGEQDVRPGYGAAYLCREAGDEAGLEGRGGSGGMRVSVNGSGGHG